MLTEVDLEQRLRTHRLVEPRLKTLSLAEEINPDFTYPCIVGGYLRNIALGLEPKDCDVAFRGKQLNQPGIVEAVREAEKRLGIEPYPEWDFENSLATGLSQNIVENAVGKLCHHTDYLTILLMDTNGKLYTGGERTLHDLENKIYDFRFEGIEIWANHRGQGRSYTSCLVGDLTRGFYMCADLQLTPSAIVKFLMSNYDYFFAKLANEDKAARIAFWLKKTKGDLKFQSILDQFNVKSLKTG